MPDPSPQNHKDEQYNLEMQRWLARQSFWYRLTHSGADPEAKSWLMMLLTLCAWLVPVALVGGFGYYILVQRYTNSAGFTRVIEQELGETLGLAMTKLGSASWKGGALTVTSVAGEGLPDSYVRRLKIASARVEVPINKLLEEAWGSDGMVIIQGLELELRGGLLGATEAARVAQQQQEQAKAERMKNPNLPDGPVSGSLGVNPDGAQFAPTRVVARNSTIRWGADARNAGSLTGTTVDAYKQADGWVLNCSGGEFTQGWLKNALVDELALELGGGKITVRRFAFRLKEAEGKQGSDGVGEGSGLVQLGNSPLLELHINLKGVEINRILPDAYQRAFSGRVDGKVSITGGTNSGKGYSSKFSLQFQPGFGFGMGSTEVFPLLEVLGEAAANVPVRYIETKQGGVTCTLADGVLRCDGVNVIGSEGERVEGSFTLDVRDQAVKGAFRVGVKPETLAKNPLLKERYFPEESAGLRWLSVPLEGPLSATTATMAEGMRAALRQETDERNERK